MLYLLESQLTLPDPHVASTHSLPWIVVATLRCASFNPSKILDIILSPLSPASPTGT